MSASKSGLGREPRRRWRRVLLLVAAILAATVIVGWAWWWTPPAGVAALRSGVPETWAARERQLADRRAAGGPTAIRFSYRPLSEISIDLQLAVLVGEDINFFGHEGIDFTAVREAVEEWRAGEGLRGASTISQQLAKNLWLSNDRSLLRKLREARLAGWLERELGKGRILELYLNVIEFGDGLLGVEAAARHYYGMGADRVRGSEAAGLAASIPAPHVSNPSTATRAWENRRAVIERRMRRSDWLRPLLAEAAAAKR